VTGAVVTAVVLVPHDAVINGNVQTAAARANAPRDTGAGYRRARLIGLALAAVLAVPGGTAAGSPPRAAATLAAWFTQCSYRPGDRATLAVEGAGTRLTVSVEHVGGGSARPVAGRLVLAPRSFAGHGAVELRIGPWPSGLYVARVRSAGGSTFAPFVLVPRTFGESRVAVVLPTNTWQAYNVWHSDSWYLNPAVHTIDLRRPYATGGLPKHFHSYDLGFLEWFQRTGRSADFLSDDDLDAFASGAALRRLYRLIVFSGHEEYVTAHVYDLVERYRDLGGRLVFLSADNVFYKVIRAGSSLQGRWRWRDLGRPEARLVGAQYLDWNHDAHPNAPYVVTGARRAPWLFAGTGLRNGDRIPGSFGIEIDARTPQSPPGTAVLATVPDVFGPGKTAEMTFYRTANGAEVFDAGTINFGGAARNPIVGRMLDNLWAHLTARS
jgi:N,N-dimethylformamidase beta subunit-like, C-terminal